MTTLPTKRFFRTLVLLPQNRIAPTLLQNGLSFFTVSSLVLSSLVVSSLVVSCLTESAQASKVPVDLISYKAKTNMSAISVAGKSKSAPSANVEAQGDTLTKFEMEISPNELDSGLSLRDSHMREKIFQNADGSLPVIKFELTSPLKLTSEPTTIAATLEIRGKKMPFEPKCSGHLIGTRLKFDCKGLVNLEKYSIPIPTHLGVKVQPDVEVAIATDEDLKP